MLLFEMRRHEAAESERALLRVRFFCNHIAMLVQQHRAKMARAAAQEVVLCREMRIEARAADIGCVRYVADADHRSS